MTADAKPQTARKKRRIIRVEGPDPIDVHVGVRLRIRRTQVGLTQEQLGNQASVAFQQIQKYEKGFNRISASRIVQLSRALGCSPAYFFEGLDGLAEDTPAPPILDMDVAEMVGILSRMTITQRAPVRQILKSLEELQALQPPPRPGRETAIEAQVLVLQKRGQTVVRVGDRWLINGTKWKTDDELLSMGEKK